MEKGPSLTRDDSYLPAVGTAIQDLLRKAQTTRTRATDCRRGAAIHARLCWAETQRAGQRSEQLQPRQQCASRVVLRAARPGRGDTDMASREGGTAVGTASRRIPPVPQGALWSVGLDSTP